MLSTGGRPSFDAASLQSGHGALPPEPGGAAAMQHRQHDDAVPIWSRQVDDAVGEPADKGGRVSDVNQADR